MKISFSQRRTWIYKFLYTLKSATVGGNMAGNTLTIKLTADQQNQIREAIGRSISELHLNLNLAAAGELTQADLDQVSAGSSGADLPC